MARSLALMSVGVAAVLAVAIVSGQAPAGPVPIAASLTLPSDITSLTAINRSSTIAVGLKDGRVAVWNGQDAAPSALLKPHTEQVIAVGSSADGGEVWSLATDGSLARTPVTSGAASTSRRIETGTARMRAAVFSADASLLVAGGEHGEIRVFDTASGALRQTLRGHRTELQVLALRPGTATLASASAEADLRLWDAAAGRELGFVDGDLSLFALAFSPRDGMLAAGGVDRRLTLRAPATLKPAAQMTLQAPRMAATLAWSPDGRLIALGDLDDETLSKGGIQIVDAATLVAIAHLDTGSMPADALVFSSDGRTVVGFSGPVLRAWTVPTRAGSQGPG